MAAAALYGKVWAQLASLPACELSPQQEKTCSPVSHVHQHTHLYFLVVCCEFNRRCANYIQQTLLCDEVSLGRREAHAFLLATNAAWHAGHVQQSII